MLEVRALLQQPAQRLVDLRCEVGELGQLEGAHLDAHPLARALGELHERPWSHCGTKPSSWPRARPGVARREASVGVGVGGPRRSRFPAVLPGSVAGEGGRLEAMVLLGLACPSLGLP